MFLKVEKDVFKYKSSIDLHLSSGIGTRKCKSSLMPAVGASML